MIEKLGKLVRKFKRPTLGMSKRLESLLCLIIWMFMCVIPILNIFLIVDMIQDYDAPEDKRKYFKSMKSQDEFAGYITVTVLVVLAFYFHAIGFLCSL